MNFFDPNCIMMCWSPLNSDPPETFGYYNYVNVVEMDVFPYNPDCNYSEILALRLDGSKEPVRMLTRTINLVLPRLTREQIIQKSFEFNALMRKMHNKS